jgi:hypothetical protein
MVTILARMGRSVSAAGDVNGDGIDDVIIGAPHATVLGNGVGSAYVIFGSTAGFDGSLSASDIDGSNGFVLQGISSADVTGFSVSDAGDINGDGIADIIVGAHQADVGDSNAAGKSYVVFGQTNWSDATISASSLDGTNGFTLTGIDSGDFAGYSVSGAGDINGDGIDDIIIGARLGDPNGKQESGESYVVFGRTDGFAANFDLSTLNGSNGFTINGANAGDVSAVSVSAAGDFNGDGIADVVIGAYRAGPNQNASGQAYVVYGKSDGFDSDVNLFDLDGVNGTAINGVDFADFTGWSVSGAGDVNGDGVDDIIVGAHKAEQSGDDELGAAYVVFGGANLGASFELSDLDGSNGFTIWGGDFDDYAGRSVSGGGDFNGDGIADLIIGAPRADPDGDSKAGESYVLFGTDSGFDATIDLDQLNGINGFRLKGIDADDQAGTSVAFAGDINGDGFDDLAIGASGAAPNGDGSGEAYIVFGGSTSTLLNEFDLTVSATATETANGDTATTVDTLSVAVVNPLVGASSADILEGGSVNDKIFGAAGNDIITGNAGADTIDGGDGDDVVFWSVGDGDDVIIGGDGFDQLFVDLAGGGLNGVYAYANGDGDVIINNYGYDGAPFTLTVDEVEEIVFDAPNGGITLNAGDLTGSSVSNGSVIFNGSDDTDVFYSSSVNVRFGINGNGGNDTINGGSAGDTIHGGTGNDNLYGYSGDDFIYGGDGFDTISGDGGNDFIDGGTGNDDLEGYAGNDIIFGGDGDDIISGSEGDDTLDGGNGNDTLLAGEGDDTLNGGSGDDILVGFNENPFVIVAGEGAANPLAGDAGNDIMFGGDGDDRLISGSGDDTLIGGAGNDTYEFGYGGSNYLDNQGSDAATTDRLVFGGDIRSDQLLFSQVGDHLDISIIGSDDGVTVVDWFSDTNKRVDSIEAGDGAVLVEASVQKLVDAMAGWAEDNGADLTSLDEMPDDTSLKVQLAEAWQ